MFLVWSFTMPWSHCSALCLGLQIIWVKPGAPVQKVRSRGDLLSFPLCGPPTCLESCQGVVDEGGGLMSCRTLSRLRNALLSRSVFLLLSLPLMKNSPLFLGNKPVYLPSEFRALEKQRPDMEYYLRSISTFSLTTQLPQRWEKSKASLPHASSQNCNSGSRDFCKKVEKLYGEENMN